MKKSLRHAAPEHKADRDFMLEAMRTNGNALNYAMPEHKTDREYKKAYMKEVTPGARPRNSSALLVPEMRFVPFFAPEFLPRKPFFPIH